MLHLLALAGVLGISFSAVFVRLAAVSPVTAAFYRAAYAVPVLALVWAYSRTEDPRPLGSRAMAGGAGLMLAFDLALWHESIHLIGVGLATVIANVQVVFVALAAWLLHGERLTRTVTVLIGVIALGLVLTSGLARPDAYGSAPLAGAVFGVLAGACYAGFLLGFRAANRALGPTAGPLLDATIGVAAGSLLVAPLDPAFSFAWVWPAHGWLIVLALVSQVAGWLLIATALPRLPAIETSVLLLMQPIFSLFWGVAFFAERLSRLQTLGCVVVLAGVGALTRARLASPPRLATLDEGP